MAGVAEEPAHLLLAFLTLVHVGLDPGQHAVQGRAQPAHLTSGAVRGHPVCEITGGDPVRLSGHRLDRAQATTQHHEDAEADEQHHRDGAERDDDLDLIDGFGDLVEAGASDEGSAGDAQRLDPNLCPPVRADQGVRARLGGNLGRAGRQGPRIAACARVHGYLQRHLPAAGRQEGDVEGTGERQNPESARRCSLRGHGMRSSWMARPRQYAVQPRCGQGQRHLQVVVGLGEQVAAHGGDRADVEGHQRDQRDHHDAGHHLEAQLSAHQPPEQRPRAGSWAMTHRNPPSFHRGRDSLRRRSLRDEATVDCSRRRAGCGSAPARRWPACAAGR